MGTNWKINGSGLSTPTGGFALNDDDAPLPDLPLFRFMMKNLTTDWVMNHFEAIQNSPTFDQVSKIWDITITGIDLQKSDGFSDTTKGITISRMMARGLASARMSCWAMATGSPMDALACYRLIFERALLLQYLDRNNQYDEFEKYCWAEGYHWLGDAMATPLWRRQANQEEVQAFRGRQAVIRNRYFGGTTPKKPNTYWNVPTTRELVKSYSLLAPYAEMMDNDDEVRRAMERLYELGSKAVHPRIGDLMETEELGWSGDSMECMSLVVMALASLTMFGLSKHEKTMFLTDEIAKILPDGIQPS